MKIQITQSDIDAAQAQRSETKTEYLPSKYCPVVRAMRRALEDDTIEVGITQVCIKGLQHLLPQSAVNFINGFDSQNTAEPFEFEWADPTNAG